MFGQNKIHANFSVDDLSTAKSFYTDKLGFNLVRENKGEITLEAGSGTRINIYEKADHQAWNATVLGIETDDVKDAVSKLKSVGIEVEKLEGSDEDGVMSYPEWGDAAWFKDPAGNWICISHLPE
jgi:catechol 2,3-dioxygenase-like lactoylglutathione lyase family enzyme